MQDHYQTLSVARNASQDEIKSAFRRLAKQHHPDIGGDPNKFKAINEAYGVLGDATKRAEYDNTRSQFNFNTRSYHDSGWTNLDDFMSVFAGAAGFHSRRNPQRNANYRTTMVISIESVLEDQTKVIIVNDKEIEVKIPKGIRSGAVISYKGLGRNDVKGSPPGDLLIEIQVQDSAMYRRDGDDLHSTVTIDSFDAMLGTMIDFKTIRGKSVRVNIPRGLQHGTVMRLHGEGLPNQTKHYGNQYIKIAVLTPTNLTNEQLDMLSQIKSKHPS